MRVAVNFAATSTAVPTATMRSPLTATAPFSITRDEPSIVTTVAPRMIKSTRSAARPLEGATSRTTMKTRMLNVSVFLKGVSSQDFESESLYGRHSAGAPPQYGILVEQRGASTEERPYRFIIF